MAITKSVLSIMKDTMDKTLFVIATWDMSRISANLSKLRDAIR